VSDWNRGAQPYCEIHGFTYNVLCSECRHEHGTPSAPQAAKPEHEHGSSYIQGDDCYAGFKVGCAECNALAASKNASPSSSTRDELVEAAREVCRIAAHLGWLVSTNHQQRDAADRLRRALAAQGGK
jgi:hypothetical protein